MNNNLFIKIIILIIMSLFLIVSTIVLFENDLVYLVWACMSGLWLIYMLLEELKGGGK
jgi:hypothetical protein